MQSVHCKLKDLPVSVKVQLFGVLGDTCLGRQACVNQGFRNFQILNLGYPKMVSLALSLPIFSTVLNSNAK